MRFFTGDPVFMYPTKNFETDQQLDEAFKMLQVAESLNFPMAADTENSGAWLNYCGLITGHAYSILSIFTMTDAHGVVHRMVTVRNPNSFTQYKG